MKLEELIKLYDIHKNLSDKLCSIRVMNTDALTVEFKPHTGVRVAIYPNISLTKAILASAEALITTRIAELGDIIGRAEACLSNVSNVGS